MPVAQVARVAPVVELPVVFDEPPRSPDPSPDNGGVRVVINLHADHLPGLLTNHLAALLLAGLAQ